jgi:hypothetical protein
MDENSVYKDKSVEVSADSIFLKNYYFPFIGKRVLFKQIESVIVEKPTLLAGQWRIWGTGNFTIWFPLDIARPKRDKIFIVSLIGKRIRIGFTVENSEAIVQIFAQRGLINRATA